MTYVAYCTQMLWTRSTELDQRMDNGLNQGINNGWIAADESLRLISRLIKLFILLPIYDHDACWRNQESPNRLLDFQTCHLLCYNTVLLNGV